MQQIKKPHLDPLMLPCNNVKSWTANKRLHLKWFWFAFYLQHRHGIQFKGGVKDLIGQSDIENIETLRYCTV